MKAGYCRWCYRWADATCSSAGVEVSLARLMSTNPRARFIFIIFISVGKIIDASGVDRMWQKAQHRKICSQMYLHLVQIELKMYSQCFVFHKYCAMICHFNLK